jgi:hypothetical protein
MPLFFGPVRCISGSPVTASQTWTAAESARRTDTSRRPSGVNRSTWRLPDPGHFHWARGRPLNYHKHGV